MATPAAAHAPATAATPSDPPAHGDAAAHVVPVRVLVGTWLALLALTALTVAVSRLHLGPLNVVAALAVASVKATLVALYFMHLKYGARFHAVILGGAVFFVVLFAAFVLTDTKSYQPTLFPLKPGGAASAAPRGGG